MTINSNNAIEWVARINRLDFTNARLPWSCHNNIDIGGGVTTVITDCNGKDVCYFPDTEQTSDGDFSAEDICALVNMFAEIRRECGE